MKKPVSVLLLSMAMVFIACSACAKPTTTATTAPTTTTVPTVTAAATTATTAVPTTTIASATTKATAAPTTKATAAPTTQAATTKATTAAATTVAADVPHVLTGTFKGLEQGDYLHVNIKGDDGADYSFFVLKYPGVDPQDLKVGQKVKVTWQNSNEYLNPPGSTVNINKITKLEVIS